MTPTEDQIEAARTKVRNMLHAADHGNHLGEMAVLRMAASGELVAAARVVLAGLRHAGTTGCLNPDCGLHPYYGVAPHECYYKKGPEYRIGQSTLLPQSQWPDNFVLDLEPGEDPETVAYPNACGVYYCPACLAGHPSSAAQVPGDSSRDEVKPYEAEVGERQP